MKSDINTQDTLTDGEVTWKINKSLSVTGGYVTKDKDLDYCEIKMTTIDSAICLRGGSEFAKGAYMALFGADSTLEGGEFKGAFRLNAHNGLNGADLTGFPDGKLEWNNNDLAKSAIVAKSLGANGYIKYASGLSVQWGHFNSGDLIDGSKTINYPIGFVNEPFWGDAKVSANEGNLTATMYCNLVNTATVFSNVSSGYDIKWIAIGY